MLAYTASSKSVYCVNAKNVYCVNALDERSGRSDCSRALIPHQLRRRGRVLDQHTENNSIGLVSLTSPIRLPLSHGIDIVLQEQTPAFTWKMPKFCLALSGVSHYQATLQILQPVEDQPP